VNDFATALRRLKKRKRVVSPDVVYESWFS
jgi:hypothetical protein